MSAILLSSVIVMMASEAQGQSLRPVPKKELRSLLIGKQIVFPPPNSVLPTIRQEIFRADGLHTRKQYRGGGTSSRYIIENGKYCVNYSNNPYCILVYKSIDNKYFASEIGAPKQLSEFSVKNIGEE